MFENNREKVAFGLFAKRALVLIVTGHIVVGFLNWVAADFIKRDFQQFMRFRRDLFSGIISESQDIKYLVLGDSTTLRSILPAKTGHLRGVNLAAWSFYSPEAYFVYKDFLKTKSAPKCVIYSTTYGGYDYHLEEYWWQMLIPAGNYRLDELADLYQFSRRLNRAPGNSNQLYWTLAKAMWKQVDYFFDWGAIHTYLFQPHVGRLTPRLTYRSIRGERGAYPLNSEEIHDKIPFVGRLQSYLQERFEPDPVIDHYFNKLLNEAAATNTQVLVYWAPLANSLRNSVSEQWVIDATKHISKLIGSHPNAEDHLQISWEPDIHFTDGSHVNRRRGIEYTKDLIPALEKCLNR